MGDALIVRRGGSSSSIGKLKTVIITQDTTWTVPKAKDQMFMVRIFGGGQAGACLYYDSNYNTQGGCGGMMNNGILLLNEGDNIPVTIGNGGIGRNSSGCGDSGKTTFFGEYLSAYGGGQYHITAGGSGGGFTGVYHNSMKGSNGLASVALQFGGGGGYKSSGIALSTSYGGKWGGGGGITVSYNANSTINSYFRNIRTGGCIFNDVNNITYNTYDDSDVIGYTGLAGNGGFGCKNSSNAPINGSNTKSMTGSFDLYEFNGYGQKGTTSTITVTYSNGTAVTINNAAGGGGGYGGNGGNYCGGGGGYGGNGGNNIGGGGGYGADGGDGSFYGIISNNNSKLHSICGGGGGGGYGPSGKGGNAEKCSNLTKNSSGSSNENNSTFDVIPAEDGGFAAGGGCFGYRKNSVASNGGNGICIITYYA